MAAALILGSKDNLNSKIKNAYANTGAMHVLAVSGLHVGILALLVNFLLGIIETDRFWFKKVKGFILLIILWVFAFITGASASVLRASTMFSFVIVGRIVNRKINIYNSLGASAFLLLYIDPYMLNDIGFQLSYVALCGIIYLHERIYKLYYINNRLGDWIWSGISISFAAQVSTLPLTLYYFHQFPIFFWLSGLIVTLFAGIILGLGLFLLILNSIPFLGVIIGYALYSTIWIMNSLIFLIQKLPGALWENFWLELWQVGLLYITLISSIVFFKVRILKWLIVPLLCIIILLGHELYKQQKQQNQNYLCIYNCKNNTLISCINGNSCVTIASPNLINSPKINYVQKNQLCSLGVINNEIIELKDSIINKTINYNKGLGKVKERRFLLYSKKECLQKSYVPLDVDYVIIHDNPPMKKITDIQRLCNYKKLIFDGSNKPWKIKKWIKECKNEGIEYYDVSNEGCLIIK